MILIWYGVHGGVEVGGVHGDVEVGSVHGAVDSWLNSFLVNLSKAHPPNIIPFLGQYCPYF